MAFAHHSAIGVAAWQDLLRLLRDDEASGVLGTPRLKTIGGKEYWYDHYRIGDQTVDRYIGENTLEISERLSRHAVLAEAARSAAAERARLMRVLRAEGFLMPDLGTGQILAAMARVGVFRLGGTLVGTQAFRAYEGELGLRIGFERAAMTDDIDIASFERLSLVLEDRVDPPLDQTLSQLRFDPVPSLDGGRVWRWRQTGRQTLVEFLTPSFDETEGLRPLRALGVDAQSLHYLNYLIADPIRVPVLYRGGVLVQVPRPERFAIHKLIVADRRRDGPDSLKSRKDRAQAAFLIEALAAERPFDLAEALSIARNSGPAWRRRLDATLAQIPESKKMLEELPD